MATLPFAHLLIATTLLAASAVVAQHDHSPAVGSIKAEFVSVTPPVAGKTTPAVIRLLGKNGRPVTFDDLQVAHTEKLHLLVVDETLNDYHHEHPVAGEKPGEYRFEFSPRFGGTYHVWADVVPTATSKQEYAKTTIKVQGPPATKNHALNSVAEAEGYRFSLTTENKQPFQTGKATLVKIKVATPDGKDFAALEPVMGAFAHMVAFPENLGSVTHVHPMGKEPDKATDRGGPELSFHVEPETSGFLKLFLQTQIGGREVYAAFALEVQAGSAAEVAPAGEYTCPMHPEVKQKMSGKCSKCGMSLVATDQAHDHKHEH